MKFLYFINFDAKFSMQTMAAFASHIVKVVQRERHHQNIKIQTSKISPTFGASVSSNSSSALNQQPYNWLFFHCHYFN